MISQNLRKEFIKANHAIQNMPSNVSNGADYSPFITDPINIKGNQMEWTLIMDVTKAIIMQP